jgi:hypothetical protein
MKRTGLAVNEELLTEAMRVFGVRTRAEAVNMALEEVIRWRRILSIRNFFGSGIWEGPLHEQDGQRTRSKRGAAKR